MKHRIALVLLALALILPFRPPIPVQADRGDPFAAILSQRMPELLAKYRIPGAVVSYIKNGEVAWTQAYGLANGTTGKPMSPELIFNFGSTGKVLTGWGVMRLVEQGKVDLDGPVNQYLKRWQVRSDAFDPNQVTLRRLLSHTAGLTGSGFTDYSPRRILPSLVQMLEGQNQLDGKVVIFQDPGKGFQYSGGGYALLQMVIEDVTGESFAQFMEREVTRPLSMPSLHWVWTPELTAAAPTPYGPQSEPLEYRQLASQAVGSEIATVPDYARFIAAAVTGPAGEPVGRGVLKPETIAEMVKIQPGASDEGLAYGVTDQGSSKLLQHFGGNDGWSAFFSIDTGLREGLVLANNSSNGFHLNAAVQNLWLTFLKTGGNTASEPDPGAQGIPLAGMTMLALAGLIAVPLMVSLVIFMLDLRAGRRIRANRRSRSGLVGIFVWAFLALLWIYWFYTTLPLPFPPAFPDLWRMPQTDLVTIALLAWGLFRLMLAWFPKKILSHSQQTIVSASTP
jgi:CubicO group peptidase (beta-lactamase class C family)